MASEKVTLLDLSFNTSEGLDGLDALIAKSLELAETKKQLTATMKDEQKQVTDAGKAFKAGAITQDEYKKTVENSTRAQVEITKQINVVNRSITDNNQEIKVNTTLMTSQEDSVNALRAQLAKNTKELNAMSAATRNNTEEGKALVTETKEISDKLKEMEKAVGDNRRNVGNYAESIDEALKNTKGLSGATGTLASALSTGTAGVKAFSVALKANPLVAVVSVVLLLVSSIEKLIKRNSEAAASLKAAFAPFDVIFTRILDGLTSMLSGVAKAFEWITTKVVGLLDAIGLISEETKKAGEAAAQLSKAELDIYEAETKNLVTLSAMSRELAKQKTIVGDQLKSAKERNEAAQKGISILKQMEKAEVDVLRQKYEQIKAQNSLSYTSKEDRRTEMQALADLQAKQAEYTDKRKELENQASGLIASENAKNAAAYKASETAKAQAAIKAAQDAENAKRALQQETIKQMEVALTKLNLSIQEKEVTDDGGKKRIKDAELLAKEQLDIEKEMLKQGLITQQEYNAREQEIRAQQLQVQRDEADRFNAERISNFEAAANKELEIQHYKLQQGLISREEYENAETALRIEARELRNQIEEEQDNLDRERRAMDEANRKELEMANITNQYELRQVQLDAQYAQEMAAAERIGADTTLVQQKYEKAKEDLTKARVNAELTMTAGLAGQMSDLLGEESAAGKAFAVVQATINTYLGATKALAQGGILGIAQAAIVTAFGMKQVLTIAKQKDPDTKVNTSVKKYAKGGTIVGKSHAQGGVKFVGDNGQAFEAEGGENVYILKKTASAEINALSDLNVARGGKSFHTAIPSKFAEGGTVVNMLTPLAPKFKKGDRITNVADMRQFSNSELNSVNNTVNSSDVKYEKGGLVEKVLANPSISNESNTVNNTVNSSDVKYEKGGLVEKVLANPSISNFDTVNNTVNSSDVKYEKGGLVEKVLANPSISNFDTVNNTVNSSDVKYEKGGLVEKVLANPSISNESNTVNNTVNSSDVKYEKGGLVEKVLANPSISNESNTVNNTVNSSDVKYEKGGLVEKVLANPSISNESNTVNNTVNSSDVKYEKGGLVEKVLANPSISNESNTVNNTVNSSDVKYEKGGLVEKVLANPSISNESNTVNNTVNSSDVKYEKGGLVEKVLANPSISNESNTVNNTVNSSDVKYEKGGLVEKVLANPSISNESNTVNNTVNSSDVKYEKGGLVEKVLANPSISNESNTVNNTVNSSDVKYEKGGLVEKVLANPSISNFDTVNNSFSSSNVKNQKFANGGRVNNYTYRGGNTVKNVSMPTYSSGGNVWESNAYRELNTISNVDIFSTVSNHRNYINTSNLYKFADGGMAASISEANRLKQQVGDVQLSKESISQLAAVVIEAVSAMPSPIVSVHDIDTAQNKVNVVQSFATY